MQNEARRMSAVARRLGRRLAAGTAVGALTVGALAMSSGSAFADSQYFLTDTGHGVGVYSQPNSASPKTFGDLWSDDLDSIYPHCWTVGNNVGNGDVWYQISNLYSIYYGEDHPGIQYVYGGYVDGNALFHSNTLPRC
ncbi:hypothetical protein [Actinacidiphila rubida]|uniref:Uncharacterized protein n=1 Tax=Actinacidiphila rubida TaxID=310780 RepID=A0A1H8EQ83_9ACTN|nr:hypothetical protein [Actinacidiphila rubida]SEN20918.1 hypothetical protein SAMN05216267_1002292 [Actinacidiphila rubida]